MTIINVKISTQGKNKYRKLLSTNESIYPPVSEAIQSISPYTPGAVLENGEWFYVDNATAQNFASPIFGHNFESVDFDSLDRKDFRQIDYLFVYSNGDVFFQKTPRTKLVSKKSIMCLGEDFKYNSNQQEVVINELPDAIYRSSENRLYFRRLETITSIFKGIDQLYREATNEEVVSFLEQDFISLQNEYGVSDVKTANRKRIALAKKTLSQLSEPDQKKIFTYIGEYCPGLKADNESFEIGTEDELKMLLFGIEQRFYTTPVGGERRIANSVILF